MVVVVLLLLLLIKTYLKRALLYQTLWSDGHNILGIKDTYMPKHHIYRDIQQPTSSAGSILL